MERGELVNKASVYLDDKKYEIVDVSEDGRNLNFRLKDCMGKNFSFILWDDHKDLKAKNELLKGYNKFRNIKKKELEESLKFVRQFTGNKNLKGVLLKKKQEKFNEVRNIGNYNRKINTVFVSPDETDKISVLVKVLGYKRAMQLSRDVSLRKVKI